MFRSTVKMQIRELTRRKTSVFTYIALLLLVLSNFLTNAKSFHEIRYVSEMFDFAKVLTLSTWTPFSHYLMEYLPILLVIPTACTILNDRNTRIQVYITAKVGKRNYWYGKLLSTFCVTFFIFTIPFLIEVGLSCLCLNLQSLGDPSGLSYHVTVESDSRYFLSTLFFENREFYAIVCIMLFGFAAGILAMWNVAITSLYFFKFKLFAFLPIYILLFALTFAEKIIQPSFSMNYFLILRMFEGNTNINYWAVLVFLGALCIVSFLLIEYRIRKEDVL